MNEKIVTEFVLETQKNVKIVIEILLVNYVKQSQNFVVLDPVVLDLLNYKLDVKIILEKFIHDIISTDTNSLLLILSTSNLDVWIVNDLSKIKII